MGSTNQLMMKLSRKFQVKVKQIHLIKRGVYHLISFNGEHYCLKRMHFAKSRLNWMDTVLRQFRSRGFSTIAWRKPQTRTGQLLYAKPHPTSSRYILTPWLLGQRPLSASKKDMRTCAKTLAKFHLIGRKVKIPKAGVLNMLGKWPALLRTHAAFLEKQIENASQNKYGSPLDSLLQTYGNRLVKRAKDALQTLNSSDYYVMCRRAKNTGALCHGDSGPKNFVLTQKGAYMIDFETLRLDLRVYDLYRMIRLSCKNKGWDFEIARAILDSYRSVSELERGEYVLLKVWLGFPEKAYKLLSQYDRVGKEEKRNLERKLKKTLIDERKMTIFLYKLNEYAGKV